MRNIFESDFLFKTYSVIWTFSVYLLTKQTESLIFALIRYANPLKLPFINDSNSLDKSFYSELPHIIGLTETKQGGKKLIERKKEGERSYGTLIENAILRLDTLKAIHRLEKPELFGEIYQE